MDYLGLADNDFDSDDSFFNDPKIAGRQKKSGTSVKKDKSVKDIFGFEETEQTTTTPEPTKAKVRFNVEEPPIATAATAESKTSIASSSKGLEWLGLPSENQEKDIQSSATTIKTPVNLFDDIAPRNGQRKSISFEDILKDSKAQRPGSSANLERAVSQPIGPSSLEGETRPPRRGRRGSGAGVPDLLGLFGSGSEEPARTRQLNKQPEETVEKTSTHQDVPGWLGLQPNSNKSDTTISSRQTMKDDVKSTDEIKSVAPPLQPTVTTSNDFRTNISNLQTQESFLLLSLQLKNYEENLTEIKQQQEMILKKQENQFNLFLNKYVEKQKTIELEMLNQQERINDHIRKLAVAGGGGDEKIQMAPSTAEDTNIIEKLVKNLKQRHEEEFFLMEESYRKQISLLEKSAEKLEHHLQDELQTTRKTHEEKLNLLKTQHDDEMHFWMEKLENIEKTHQDDVNQLKINHSRVVNEIKQEFLDQIERIKEQRIRENELTSSGSEFVQKLTIGVERLERNEEILDKLQEKVCNDYNILSIARERTIENKEKEIYMMRTALEKCRQQAENDRSQLFALIRTIEGKIAEQSQNAQEERWAMQQAAATLAARAAAFDREMEFSRASISREREQLQTLKETLLAEQERITCELTEEKLKLTAAKSRHDVSVKLINNYEMEKMKTEAETAIQVAKELTEKLTSERNFVLKQKSELENYRRKLLEKERELLEREEEIEDVQQQVHRRLESDKKIIQETKSLEHRYKEKLTDLQEQTSALSLREKKLAEEKLSLSKERLNLYTSLKAQNGAKKCMLCQAEGNQANIDLLSRPSITAADTELLRYKIESVLDDDRAGSEVSKEESSSKLILSKN